IEEQGQKRRSVQDNGLHSAVLLVAFRATLFEMFLHHGFLSGFQFEHAPKTADIFARDGLEDDAVPILNEMDARARLDAVTPTDARGNDQLALRGNVGGMHVLIFRSKQVWHNLKGKASQIGKTYPQCDRLT